ncbi:MAG TPA: NfeD family protein [Rubrobacteraceae bacterium]|nr:NfeD family protein [Rubrobacteraceae bacterium]
MDWDIVFWAALAALAFAGELLTISFFLLFFSIGALAALALSLAHLPLAVQTAGFVAASILSMVILRPALLNRLALRTGERYVSSNEVTGKRGVVTSDIEPGDKGMVRIGNGEFWTARSFHPDERLERGTKVRVLDTDGLTALVESVEIEGGER